MTRHPAETDTFDQVEPKEWARIRTRRLAAGWQKEGSTGSSSQSGLPQPSPPAERLDLSPTDATPDVANGERETRPDDLVGLALSGGGVRSASFGLGVVQALHQKGVLRYVDYLSTVSGGGYLGSLWTSSVQEREGNYGERNFALAPQEDGRQPPRIQRLTEEGNYLLKVLQFTNRYIVGTILNNLFLFSGLLWVGALVAFVWRSLDFQWVRDRLDLLGFSGDVWPAILPFCVLAVFWFTSWIISYWRSGSGAAGSVARRLLWLTATALFIGLAVLVGNGDVTVSAGGVDATELQQLRMPFAVLAGLGLIPFLMPKLVVRSGAQPKYIFESWAFYYFSAALLLGIPLLIIALMARENISDYGTQRSGLLERADIKDWPAFCQWLKTKNTAELDGTADPELVNVWDKQIRLQALDTDSALGDKLQELEAVQTLKRTRRRRILGTTTWEGPITWREPNQPKLEIVGVGEDNLTNPQQELSSTESWEHWKYVNYWNRWWFLTANLARAKDDPFGTALGYSEMTRQCQTAVLHLVNEHLMKAPEFFMQPTFDIRVVQPGKGVLTGSSNDTSASKNAESFYARLTKDPQLVSLLQRRDFFGKNAFTEEQTVELNRLLLETYFPQWIRPRSDIRRVAVLEKDQMARAVWFCAAFLVWLGLGLVVRPNDTSLQSFYRNQLAGAFVDVPKGRDGLLLADIESHRKGAPYHVLVAAASPATVERDAPPPEVFQFSPDYCGSDQLGYCPTREYAGGKIDLATAMSISGAAVTAILFKNWLVRALMFILNMRLGSWMPHPSNRCHAISPSAFRIIRSLGAGPSKSQCVFLSDGGHIENLGIAPLLKRRCKLIIACDAGQDPNFDYSDLAKLLQKVRIEEGIEFVDMDSSKPLCVRDRLPHPQWDKKKGQFRFDADEQAKPHWLCARIRYPRSADVQQHDSDTNEPSDTLLIYLKPSLNGDENLDILRYKDKSHDFPHEKTTDQTFEGSQFEVYRQLGFHIGSDVCRRLPDDLWARTTFSIQELMTMCQTVSPAGPSPHASATNVAEWIETLARGDEPMAVEARRQLLQSMPEADRTMNELLQRCLRSRSKDGAEIARKTFAFLGDLWQGDDGLRGFLLDRLDYADVRTDALQAIEVWLGDAAGDHVAAKVLTLVHSEDVDVAVAAIQTLGQIQANVPDVVATLQQLAKQEHTDPQVRGKAEEILRQFHVETPA